MNRIEKDEPPTAEPIRRFFHIARLGVDLMKWRDYEEVVAMLKGFFCNLVQAFLPKRKSVFEICDC